MYLIDYYPVSVIEGGDEDNIPSTYSCVDHDDKGREYALKFNGISEEDAIVDCPIFQGEELMSGKTTIQISSESVIDDFTIDLSVMSDKVKVLNSDEFHHSSRRLGQKRIGDSTVVVIRVNSADDQPSRSAAQLSDDVFGTDTDKRNLQSGYKSCSGKY